MTVITRIPAIHKASKKKENVSKRRVAAYARVSTDSEEQLTSYNAQVSYYEEFIRSKPEWEFVNVYTDEGVTGTSTKHREGFKQMISDAFDGKIDLILTKSVSRFARNTVDSLTIIRQLKEKGIEVYFEKENIWTLDSKGELLITIMSSLAQEESHSISENVRWGIRKRYSDGKHSVAYKNFTGYDKGENGKLVINEEQAAVVRYIYQLCIDGCSINDIRRKLTEEGYKTVTGSDRWSATSIRRILSNEKYKGDALLQKTYIQDFLTKKQIRNHGEREQFYIENDHEAIINPEDWDYVQRLRAEEITLKSGKYHSQPFYGKIICGHCGKIYGIYVWHSNDKYRALRFHCKGKYPKTNPDACKDSITLHQDQTDQLFLDAMNWLYENKAKILERHDQLGWTPYETDSLEKDITKIIEELKTYENKLQRVAEDYSSGILSSQDYAEKYNMLHQQQEDLKEKLYADRKEIMHRKTQKTIDTKFYKYLKGMKKPLTEFNLDAWKALVDHMTVYSSKRIIVTFHIGVECKVALKSGK